MMIQTASEQTHGEIMTAAVALFCQHGFEAASVVDICARAGVSKSAFYHQFSSMQQLFQAILENWLENVDASLALARVPGKSIPDSLVRLAGTFGSVFEIAGGQQPVAHVHRIFGAGPRRPGGEADGQRALPPLPE